MNHDYWLGRWARGETGWHQTEPEPALVANFLNLKPTRVLVPLCGKSLDMAWLARQGHQVIGVELSELACKTFFEENSLQRKMTPGADFTLHEGGGVTILQGDIFKLTPQLLGPIGAIYDRAALIALPPALRPHYAAHLRSLATASGPTSDFSFLQILLQRIPHDEKGPPFSISEKELWSLYGDSFAITPLSRDRVELGREDRRVAEESAFLLTPKVT